MRTRIGFAFLASVVTLLLLAVAGFGTATAGNIYVNINAAGANSGTSWTDAYTDLQAALAAAVSGDNIYVAQGTYKPTSGTDRTISFQLKSGVQLWGGYRAADGARDPAFKTILSGDIGVAGDKSDNSYHVVIGIGLDYYAVTVMDGFTVTAGNANVWPGDYTSYMGGGMYIAGGGSLTLTNMTFYDNSAMEGGGLYTTAQGLTLTDVTFTGNLSYAPGEPPGGSGGAIYLTGFATLTNVTISGNSSGGQGGGIYVVNGGFATLTYVTISGNTAGVSGGGWYFYDDNDNDINRDPQVRNSILWGNSPDQIDNHRGYAYFSNNVVQDGCPNPSTLICTNIITADPRLGTLGDNGGYTQTIPLLAGSSAIDTGFDYGVAYDQRGVTRPQGAGFDIGAYEYVPVNRPPVALCKDVTAAAGPSCTGVASIDNGSSDPDGNPITLTQIPAGPYPLGNTSVTLIVTDSEGLSSQCTGTVTVADKTPPAITSVSASPSALWPPNHKMVNVTINYNATDNCGQPACQIISVTSNEPISSSDYAIVDAHHVKLSADRLGNGNGRIYTIAIACMDASGNSSNQAVTVTVPHDQGKK